MWRGMRRSCAGGPLGHPDEGFRELKFKTKVKMATLAEQYPGGV